MFARQFVAARVFAGESGRFHRELLFTAVVHRAPLLPAYYFGSVFGALRPLPALRLLILFHPDPSLTFQLQGWCCGAQTEATLHQRRDYVKHPAAETGNIRKVRPAQGACRPAFCSRGHTLHPFGRVALEGSSSASGPHDEAA